jgi:hypothetical protein
MRSVLIFVVRWHDAGKLPAFIDDFPAADIIRHRNIPHGILPVDALKEVKQPSIPVSSSHRKALFFRGSDLCLS